MLWTFIISFKKVEASLFKNSNFHEQLHVSSVILGKQLSASHSILLSIVLAKRPYSMMPTDLQGWNSIPQLADKGLLK